MLDQHATQLLRTMTLLVYFMRSELTSCFFAMYGYIRISIVIHGYTISIRTLLYQYCYSKHSILFIPNWNSFIFFQFFLSAERVVATHLWFHVNVNQYLSFELWTMFELNHFLIIIVFLSHDTIKYLNAFVISFSPFSFWPVFWNLYLNSAFAINSRDRNLKKSNQQEQTGQEQQLLNLPQRA